jgi:hypothetical protein
MLVLKSVQEEQTYQDSSTGSEREDTEECASFSNMLKKHAATKQQTMSLGPKGTSTFDTAFRG